MKTKQPKTKMNVRLLRRIERQIMAEPKQFNMDCWYFPGRECGLDIPNCGTAACIGGWAVSLANKIKPSQAKKKFQVDLDCDGFPKKAARVLGIDQAQAARLFYHEEWPEQFIGVDPNNPKQAVRRIEHFIKTNGDE